MYRKPIIFVTQQMYVIFLHKYTNLMIILLEPRPIYMGGLKNFEPQQKRLLFSFK